MTIWKGPQVGASAWLPFSCICSAKLDLRKPRTNRTDGAAESQLTDEGIRARALLKALLSWSLVGDESVGFVCSRSGFEMLFDGLAATPPWGDNKRRKISSSNAYSCRLLGRCNPHGFGSLLWGPLQSTTCGEKPWFSCCYAIFWLGSLDDNNVGFCCLGSTTCGRTMDPLIWPSCSSMRNIRPGVAAHPGPTSTAKSPMPCWWRTSSRISLCCGTLQVATRGGANTVRCR